MSVPWIFCALLLFAQLIAAPASAQDMAAADSISPDQSTVINLADRLPSLTSEIAQPMDESDESLDLPELSGRDKQHGRHAKLIHFAEKLALSCAVDNVVASLSKSAFRSDEADRLSDLLSTLGGRGLTGGLALGYLASGKASQQTYGTAIQAAGEAMLVTQSLKFLTGRKRPRELGSDADDFLGPGTRYNSFPSGHTSNAFAIATVFAEKHPKRKWLYYALATGVGLSRIQKHAHYSSDVFFGATIGIWAGHRAVRHKTYVEKFGRLTDRIVEGKR